MPYFASCSEDSFSSAAARYKNKYVASISSFLAWVDALIAEGKTFFTQREVVRVVRTSLDTVNL